MVDQPNRCPFIAYAVQRFPALRTTFVRREVDALRQLNLPIEVVSIRPADRAELEGEQEALPHLETTHYLPRQPLDPQDVWANLAAGARRPGVTLANWRLGLSNAGQGARLNRLRLWLQIWRGAVMARHLQRFGRCVHIHAQFADGGATTALVAARLLGVPFSFTSHTSFDPPALRPKLREAAFIASISRYDRRRLIEIGGPAVADKIHVIHCGVPVDQWQFRPKQMPSRPARILSIGALIEKKGHDDLIRACGRLKQRALDFRCEIVGAGPLREELSRLIECLDLSDRVRLVGPLPQSEVRAKLYGADVFALACKRAANGDTDGIPVSLMEAMAAGTPVVSTRVAGVPELVNHGETGWLAPPGHISEIAESMAFILREVEQRTIICEAARLIIEQNFSQELEAAKLAGVLRADDQRVCKTQENNVQVCNSKGQLTIG